MFNFFNPEDFLNKTKKEFNITTPIELTLDDSKEDSENITIFSCGTARISCGVKGYDWENLEEEKKIEICNTIYHELVHVRDREQIKNIIPEHIMESRKISRFGFMLFDEYIAYSEANQIYPQPEEDLKSDLDTVYYIFFNHMIKGELFLGGKNYRTKHDENRLFERIYDYCSALIARYVICGGFPDEKKYKPFTRAMESLISYADSRENLSIEDYEKIGQQFISCIISDLSRNAREIFWLNTCIER